MRRALPLLACLVLAACSSSKHAAAPAASTSAGPSASATASVSAAPSTSAAPAASAAASRSAAPSPGGSTGGTSTSGTSTSGTTGSGSHPAGARSTAPGTYTYDTSGTVKFGAQTQDAAGTSTLTVDDVANGVQRSTQKTDQGTTVQDVVAKAGGTYLAYLHITNVAFDKEFTATPNVLLVPDPATVGKSWSWTVTDTKGTTTATTTNRVVRTETLTIGGKAVPTVVLQSHLEITGDVTYKADITTWVATTYRLPVKDHQVGAGTALGQPFTTDITDVIRSVTPA